MPKHNLEVGEGVGGGCKQGLLGDVQEHIFPSTLSTDEAREDSFKV